MTSPSRARATTNVRSTKIVVMISNAPVNRQGKDLVQRLGVVCSISPTHVHAQQDATSTTIAVETTRAFAGDHTLVLVPARDRTLAQALTQGHLLGPTNLGM